MDLSTAINKLQKGKNLIRFKSFHDRIKLVNISILPRTDPFAISTNSTFFEITLNRQRDTDLSKRFTALYKKLKPLCPTLPLILVNKTRVIETLLVEFDQSGDIQDFRPIFELIIALAKDLRGEFPVFDKVLLRLMKMSDPQNPELLESILTTSCFLFKYLEEDLFSDFLSVLRNYFLSFLKSKKQHVKNFVTECLAYLLRKQSIDNLPLILDNVLFPQKHNFLLETNNETQRENFSESIALLLFHVMKGPMMGFHRNSTVFIEKIFDSFKRNDCSSDFSHILKVLWTLFIKCHKRERKPKMKSEIMKITELFLRNFDIIFGEFFPLCAKNDFHPSSVYQTFISVSVSTILISERFIDFSMNFKSVSEFLKKSLIPILNVLPRLDINFLTAQQKLTEITLNLIFAIWKSSTTLSTKLTISRDEMMSLLIQKNLCELIRNTNYDSTAIFDHFDKEKILLLESGFPLELYSSLIKRCDEEINGEKTNFHINGKILNKMMRILEIVHFLSQSKLFSFESIRRKIYFDENSNLFGIIKGIVVLEQENTLQLWISSELLLLFKPSKTIENDTIGTLSQNILRESNRSGLTNNFLKSWLQSNLMALHILTNDWNVNLFSVENLKSFVNVFDQCPTSPGCIRTASILTSKLTTYNLNEEISMISVLKGLMNPFAMSLLTHSPNLRKTSIESIRKLFNDVPIESQNEKKIMENILAVMDQFCDFKFDFRFESEMIHSLNIITTQIEVLLPLENEMIFKILLSFLVGLLKSRFAVIWKPAVETIIKLYKINKKHKGMFWEIISTELDNRNDCTNPSDLEENRSNSELAEFYDSKRELIEHCPSLSFCKNLFSVLKQIPNCLKDNFGGFMGIFTKHLVENFGFESKWISRNDYSDVSEGETVYIAVKKNKEDLLKLCEFLNCLSNVKSLPELSIKTDLQFDLKEILKCLLSFDDTKIQKSAFDCIILWEEEFVKLYKDSFQQLLDPKTSKTAMKSFQMGNKDMGQKEGVICLQEKYKTKTLSAIFRILLPLLFKTNKNAKNAKIPAFIFLSNLGAEDLGLFFELIFERASQLRYKHRNSPKKEKSFLAIDLVVLELIEMFLKYFKTSFESYKELVFGAVLIMFDRGVNAMSREENLVKKAGKVCAFCCSRVFEMVKLSSDEEKCEKTAVFVKNLEFLCQKPKFIYKIVNSSKKKGLLGLFILFSKKESFRNFLFRREIFEFLVGYLTRTKSPKICAKIVEIFFNLIDKFEKNEKDSFVIRENFELHLESLLESFRDSTFEPIDKNTETLNNTKFAFLLRLSPFCARTNHIEIFSSIVLKNIAQTLEEKSIFNKKSFGIITKMAKNLPDDPKFVTITLALLTKLSPLFSHITEPSRIIDFSNLMAKTAQKVSLNPIGDLIIGLNSFEKGKITPQIDFDKRLDSYARARAQIKTFQPTEMIPLVHIFLRDLKTTDFGLRSQSTLSLNEIIQSGREELRDVQWKVIAPFAVKCLGINNNLDTKIDALRILTSLIKKNGDFYGDLRVLMSGDSEEDFFENVFHIQNPRRRKMLKKLKNSAKKGDFRVSADSVSDVLFPILFHIILTTPSKQTAMIDDGLECVKALTVFVGWKEMLKWVGFLERNIVEHIPLGKVLVRSICTIINSFPFETHFIQPKRTLCGLKFIHPAGTTNKEFCEGLIRDLCASVKTRFETTPRLPHKQKEIALQKLVERMKKLLYNGKKREIVRVRVAAAVSRLTLLLPESVRETEINSLLIELVDALKSRIQSSRDDTRAALNGVLKIVGVSRMNFVLRILKRNLTKGYQKQILGFTVHFLLNSALNWCGKGGLDQCIKELGAVLFEDVFGSSAEERTVEKIKKSMRESHSDKSGESFRVLAEQMDFAGSVNDLTWPLLNRFFALYGDKPSSKAQSKLKELFRQIVMGIGRNECMLSKDVLLYVFQVLKNYLGAFRESERETEENCKIEILSQSGIVTREERERSKFDSREDSKRILMKFDVLMRFSFDLLKRFLMRNRRKITGFRPLLVQFKPLFSAFLDTIAGRSSEVAEKLVKCASLLLNCDEARDFESFSREMTSFCFGSLSRGGSKGLAKASYDLLATTLGRHKGYRMNPNQLSLLMDFIKENVSSVDDNTAKKTALALFKAVLARKKPHAAIYSCIETVQEALVKNPDPATRKESSKCLVLFLVNYPMGEERMKKHLQFLVANVVYSSVSGRISVVQSLEKLAKRFPQRVLNEYFDAIVFPLINSFVNESDENCQIAQRKALLTICELTAKQKLDQLIECLEKWIAAEDLSVNCAALKVCTAVLKVLVRKENDCRFDRLLKAIWNVIEIGKSGEMDGKEVSNWKRIFLAMVFLRKTSEIAPEKILKGAEETRGVFRMMVRLIGNGHFWVRCEAVKMISALLDNVEGDLFESDRAIWGEELDIAKSIISATNCRFFDGEIGALVNGIVKKMFGMTEKAGKVEFLAENLLFYSKTARNGNLAMKNSLLDLLSETVGEMKTFDRNTQYQLVRTVLSFSGRQSGKENANRLLTDELNRKSDEILNRVKSVLGEEKFLEVYGGISKDKKAVRVKRKRREKLDRVTNTARSSRKTLKKHKRMKMQKKKRKLAK